MNLSVADSDNHMQIQIWKFNTRVSGSGNSILGYPDPALPPKKDMNKCFEKKSYFYHPVTIFYSEKSHIFIIQ